MYDHLLNLLLHHTVALSTYLRLSGYLE